MSCSCGGQVTKVSETANGQKLTYQKCPSCGRCNGWSLKAEGSILSGEEARRFYRVRIVDANLTPT